MPTDSLYDIKHIQYLLNCQYEYDVVKIIFLHVFTGRLVNKAVFSVQQHTSRTSRETSLTPYVNVTAAYVTQCIYSTYDNVRHQLC